ncbi:5-methyltetrahydropteroyltriglutamate--homocysteine S-methyltransferase [Paenibacillus spiritus]|uniref:5-methyltetrahydropteroyltriglutamate--homocysteine methyltransferase n=1 Tax=Paenibacillus spiritus TaxID=2496557 RepID=A0A5J5GH39_9BACL|nr:5-methyltetrahydropteroyltriglutamate--homocysteine S-methyltransferase [Paenibacillus spiritus]KAA9007526.1 5-methyltetrahydropteroyltriglutamate--homocysteine S-methyltransferase [Paenibacillus spiritus]
MGSRIRTGNLGYPRIGENREWKTALEAYWRGDIGEAELDKRLQARETENWLKQKAAGLDVIPVGDFTYYDHMLDMAVMMGVIPKRFGAVPGRPVSRELYYAMARGREGAAACEMTKWFNTNYHYIVPELGDAQPELLWNKPLEAFRAARERAGIHGRPVLVGLYTFLKLSKGCGPEEIGSQAERFLPVYARILKELEAEGAEWVQIDEPAIVTGLAPGDLRLLQRIYGSLAAEAPGLKLLIQTYFEAAEPLEELLKLPVAGLGLDLVHDGGATLRFIERSGWPEDKTLAAGVIDGRGIWRADPEALSAIAERLLAAVPAERLLLQPSCSLLHVPVTVRTETELKPEVRAALAFADEKLEELWQLGEAAGGGEAAEQGKSRAALAVLRALPERNRADVAALEAGLTEASERRSESFERRAELQRLRWKLPVLPTTTIGSFPQTADVRQARLKWRRGDWENERYQSFIRGQIREAIGRQEDIGLDVLVHGEFERTDMVEFFGEKLDGFLFTRGGWVQSYGSRCVKPPIIYGDVAWGGPMTVEETAYAQSLTSSPVKGMLTGPVTILAWSFLRDDISRERIAGQIALALRQEVLALEEAGIGMIQVDEPALREGMPLKPDKREDYLRWAVRAFRIATSPVRPATQIHTHMCYCEFSDMIDAIDALDADVISIESSRSHGELVSAFEGNRYRKGIGLGVYDIHSPQVPDTESMLSGIERALRVLAPGQFWINPDCGLKTRGWAETEASLRHMVEAARRARAELIRQQNDLDNHSHCC